MGKVYLELGTNLGNREENLKKALQGVGKILSIIDISPIYETKAWGFLNQPDFLNLCLSGTTELDPPELLKALKNLELELGREPTFHWGPRLIDIDILFYDDVIIELPYLTIPHKGIADRAFVLIPLSDIAPDLIHPQLQKSIKELMNAVDGDEVQLFRDISREE